MAAAIASNIASPTATKDEAVITVTGLPPADPTTVYHLEFDAPGATPQYDMTSQTFQPDANGAYAHLPIVFPVAGAWTVKVVNAAASVVASQAITVQ